ncbi:MAG: U32 family peptidase [Phycisphaerae bacterium]|nr:U32 family peptidase [Phycisphaerae bacterium]
MSATPTTVPELLAPAGDWDALRAAVANGADGVYFGLESFNARQRAQNFTRAALPEIMAYLHGHNVKGYVALNTLIFSAELPQAVAYAEALATAGADAVIVQDLGLVRLLQRVVPTLPIHASTQMTQTAAGGIAYLQALGVSRVIVARELTLAELTTLVHASPLPLEVFVHGALCISYSGQCLASEALWSRSANRGLCAQACRLPYHLIVDGRPLEQSHREYLLSPHDLAAHALLPKLVALGIAAFKIEGRLKSAHYVAAATQVYRAALDAAVQRRPFVISPAQQADLTQSFSRGFGHGFLEGVNHQTLVPGACPRNRGVCVGTVVARVAQGVKIELTDPPPVPPLKPGDGVVFDPGHPDQNEQGGRIYTVAPVRHAQRGAAMQVLLTFGRGDVSLAALRNGCRVWRTDDPTLRRKLETSFGRDVVVRRVPIHVRIEAAAGQVLAVTVRDEAGRTARVCSDAALEPARRHSLTVGLIREQFARLGDTPFALGEVELQGPEGATDSVPVMAPKSVLNQLRRRAVEELGALRAAAARHPIAEPRALEQLRQAAAALLVTPPASSTQPRLHVLVRDGEQFAAVCAWSPPSTALARGTLYCDFESTGDYGRAVAAGRAAGWPVGLATARIVMPSEEGDIEQLAQFAPDAVLVRNLTALRHLRQHAGSLRLIGDYALNIANEIAAAELCAGGLSRITPSYDLNWPRLADLLARIPADACEVVIHQHIPLFHTRHCLFAASLSDGTRCGDCGWHCRSHALHLRDRVGMWHPVLRDPEGRNTVFHAAVQSAAELVPDMRRRGVRHFRVEFLREPAARCRGVLDLYAALVTGEDEPAAVLRRLHALCPAGLGRGAWAATAERTETD